MQTADHVHFCNSQRESVGHRLNNFAPGVLEGMRRQWDAAGRLVSEEHYENGKLDGEQRAWNAARGRWETSLYRDGAFVDVIRSSDAPPRP